ncbi:MAG: class I SAM-dependent methyltransferase [Clostridiales Family XIII bacterium]|jgi:tRNA (adenine22-N1)-methyltransferase|nr:class I SAM-dependent methyltransferase [Clostridiales Family XIII bacterium]
MNKKLSPRLLRLAAHVEAGETLCDIGPDHAYLPRLLVSRGVCPRVVLSDVKEGPLRQAWGSVCTELGEDRPFRAPSGIGPYAFRLGDGLAALSAGEVDAVVIAGMGGETIIAILGADAAKTASFRKFILQPRTKADELRGWLQGAGWTISAEETATEKGRDCRIIVASPPAG